ncbi:Phi-29-like late activator, partial [Enterococcus durans]
MRLDQTVIDLLKTIDRVKMLESSGELNLLFLKKNFEKYTDQIELIQKEIKRISHLYTMYGKEMQVSERVIWENYYKLEFKFQYTAKEFLSFMEEYKHFIPSNANKLKQRIREILSKKGLIVDGSFEGDYVTWIGVYARPKDKPTYL